MLGYVSLFQDPDEVEVQFRAEGEGGTIGHSVKVVKPGGSLYGVSYEDLVKHGGGQMDFPAPGPEYFDGHA